MAWDEKEKPKAYPNLVFVIGLLTQISFPACSSLGIGRKLQFFLKCILYLGKPKTVVWSRGWQHFSKKGVFVSSATNLFW